MCLKWLPDVADSWFLTTAQKSYCISHHVALRACSSFVEYQGSRTFATCRYLRHIMSTSFCCDGLVARVISLLVAFWARLRRALDGPRRPSPCEVGISRTRLQTTKPPCYLLFFGFAEWKGKALLRCMFRLLAFSSYIFNLPTIIIYNICVWLVRFC